jgi:hypothetical protein
MAEKTESKPDIKVMYEKLKTKYHLPSFQDLEENFDISLVEDNNILRGVRKKMSEKLENYAKMLEEYIQPESSFSGMYEVKDFTENNRKNIMILFKKMMVFYKEAVKLNLNFGEERDAEFIKSLFASWPQFKKEIAVIIDITKESWNSKDEVEEYSSYMG